MKNGNGQLLVHVGKNESCVLTWMGVGKSALLDSLDTLRDAVREARTPFYRTGSRTGEQVTVTDFASEPRDLDIDA